jgi:DNA-binding NarL/FixJ family response regulator
MRTGFRGALALGSLAAFTASDDGTVPMSFQPQRVLIIDDHGPCRAVVRELLERRGFAVVAEADGAKAGLEAAEAAAPDAVVLDVHLGDGNGIEVCRALTEANPALAVLLVSADAHDGRWVSDCGAVAFLPKIRLASADLGELLRAGADEDLAGRATG